MNTTDRLLISALFILLFLQQMLDAARIDDLELHLEMLRDVRWGRETEDDGIPVEAPPEHVDVETFAREHREAAPND